MVSQAELSKNSKAKAVPSEDSKGSSAVRIMKPMYIIVIIKTDPMIINGRYFNSDFIAN